MIELTQDEALEIAGAGEHAQSLMTMPRGMRLAVVGAIIELVRLLQLAGYRIERPHLRSN